MPRLEYFVVSESLASDQVSGRLSLFHILEQLRPQRFPAFIPKCVASVTFVFENDEIGHDYQAIFSVSLPGDQETRTFQVNFTPSARNHRVLQRSIGMPLNSHGSLNFGVKLSNFEGIEAHHEIIVHEPDSGQPTDGTLVYSPNPADDQSSEGT